MGVCIHFSTLVPTLNKQISKFKPYIITNLIFNDFKTKFLGVNCKINYSKNETNDREKDGNQEEDNAFFFFFGFQRSKLH